jgi:uroporphyrinogen-III synthase
LLDRLFEHPAGVLQPSWDDDCASSSGLWYGEDAHAFDSYFGFSFVTMTQNKSFSGMTVAAFESRMATEMTRLIVRYGGRPFVAPALREIPIQDNPAALRFGARLIDGQVDILILMTGIGTTTLFDILRSRHPLASIMAGLKQTAIIARGPKPVAALKTLGLIPTLTVPEPNTWVEVVSTLDEYRPVKGLRVAVQEYGISNADLLDALKQRGAEVFPVPIYRWALPEDTGPLKQVLGEIVAGHIQVMLVTNAAQIDHVMQILEQEGTTVQFKKACGKMVVASIGPTASERLTHYNLPVDFEPSHPKMGVLVKETSEQASALLNS